MIEVIVPDLRRLPPGEQFVVFDGGGNHWGVDEYDVANQGLISHHFTRVGDRIDYSSGPFRYVWPAELDLMAEMAGMSLRNRWADWDRSPFTSESRKFVSVWREACHYVPAAPSRLRAFQACSAGHLRAHSSVTHS